MSFQKHLKSTPTSAREELRTSLHRFSKEDSQALISPTRGFQYTLEANKIYQSSNTPIEKSCQPPKTNQSHPLPDPHSAEQYQSPGKVTPGQYLKPFSEGLYRTLGPSEIRILEISPGLDDEVIQGKLHYITLASQFFYHALSYTWGDLSLPRVNIIVDDQDLAITENCRDALLELRREAVIKTIWIDAICINQNSLEERSSQVSLMGGIYRMSSGLVIWLGREADESEEAFGILREAFTQFKDAEPSTKQLLLAQIEEHPQKTDREAVMHSLFRRPWFVRVWVLQEFVISCATHGEDKTIFYCGASRLSAREMSVLTDIFQEYHLADQTPESTAIISLFAMYESAGSPMIENSSDEGDDVPALNLLSLILEGYDLEATNPLDRIYAHLGYVFDMHQPQIFSTNVSPLYPKNSHQATQYATDRGLTIDYTKSPIDVYSSFIRFIFNERGSLNIISLCGKDNNFPERTWTLNLERYDPTYTALLGEFLEDSAPFRPPAVSGPAASAAKAKVSFSSDLTVLSVQGIKVDRLQYCREPTSIFSIYKDESALESFVQAMVEQGIYPDIETAMDIIWETWTNNYDQDEDAEDGIFHWLYDKRPDGDDFKMAWDREVHFQLYRELFLTDGQKIVKAWNNCQKGDWICIIPGCDVPLVLREVGDYYELVGDCYLYGYMKVEEMENTIEERKHELMTFDLH